MKSRHWIAAFFIFCVPASAFTAVTVNCNGGAADYPNISAAVAALKTLPVSGNALIDVTGVCTEKVVIDHFAVLTLSGHPGSAIVSPNSNSAIRIDDSNTITVGSFAIRGGNPAVWVRRSASVTFNSCNVGSQSAKGPGSGVRFEQHAVASLINTSVDNFTSSAIAALDGSFVTVQGSVPVSLSNSAAGASIVNLSSLALTGKVTVENNGGTGLVASAGSTLSISSCNPGEMAIRGSQVGIASINSNLQLSCPVVIEGNHYYGVSQQFSGYMALYQAVIRNNGGGLPGLDSPGGGVLLDGAAFYISEAQVLNNIGAGITIKRGSRGLVFDSSVQFNSTDGIQASQGSVLEMSALNNVTGHPGSDLLCNTEANVFGTKTGIGKLKCPGFSSESGPKPFVPPIP
jgi:hypothetical protein